MYNREPESQLRPSAKKDYSDKLNPEIVGFFDGPWLRRAACVALAVVILSAIIWFLWIKIAVPWRQAKALAERGIKVAPEEEPELRNLLGEGLSLLQEKQYNEARKYFLEAQRRARTARTRTDAEGLVTATFFGAGEHQEGLEYLCEISTGRLPHDVRHRFGFHAHLRAIAVREGYEEARAVVAEFRPECPRRDLSYVWAGISQEKAEFLAKGVTLYDEAYELPDKDRDYLVGVVRDYPEDPFLDHALYFLRRFDTLIEKYPQSLILDVVYRAAAQQALEAKDYDRAIIHLKAYLEVGAKRWPSLPDEHQVNILLARAYSGKGEMKTAISWLLSLGSDAGPELADLLGQKGAFADANEVRTFLSSLTGYYPADQIGNIFDTHCQYQFNIATEPLEDLNYIQALAEYQSVRDVFVDYGLKDYVPWCVEQGTAILKRLTQADRNYSATGLFQLGKDLRTSATELGNRAFLIAAAKVWEDCSHRFPRTDEAPKALYLAGAAWRRLQNYEKARDHFRELAEIYPESELADDALAEVGWYYLFVRKHYKLARTYFNEVASMDKGNARDNALFWLARTYFEEGDYSRALDTYRLLRKRFPYGRLARGPYAPQEIARLVPVVASKAKRHTLSNVEFASSDDPVGLRVTSAKLEKNGLRTSDIITAVNGIAIDSAELLYDELAPSKPGADLSLTVIRKQSELTISGKVSEEIYYQILPE